MTTVSPSSNDHTSNNHSNILSSEHTLEPWLFEAFGQLIVERTGLNLLSADRSTVCEKIWARTRATRQPCPSSYYQLLTEADGDNQAITDAEWPHLIALLTNSESYFFRDRGQMSVLKHHILPELIVRKFPAKEISICSAGCSRGEEAYSLAILLSELIPNIAEWQVNVFGVDINSASIAHAEAGRYRQWSLRGVEAHQRELYFHRHKQHYCIDPKFQQMVTFTPLNLVRDSFPTEIHGLDLIICRNVFIYFDAASIAAVIGKFYDALQPQGYLLTGHAELYGQDMQPFQIQSFPGSLVFQRPATDAPSTTTERLGSMPESIADQVTTDTVIAEQNLPTQVTISSSETSLRQAYLAFHNQELNQAIEQIEATLAQQPSHAEAYCLMAKVYFTAGQFQLATEACQNALQVLAESDHNRLEPHYILAKIAAEQGELTAAKRILRKIIYLDTNAVTAYLELSQLYQQEGNLNKSDRLRQLAFEIFRQQRSPLSEA